MTRIRAMALHNIELEMFLIAGMTRAAGTSAEFFKMISEIGKLITVISTFLQEQESKGGEAFINQEWLQYSMTTSERPNKVGIPE
ncbi:unnamed protein product [Angiostrongylus costaricensis]|uniref:NR LBD domain-containing protein n=1 Tax=Angiostrongylus costaricensis TaxID=334426 RepID=A0A0R3PW11_ANGCS|nr:unnamed protein product [Angiostrongylus costaricensis]